jgi:hypothetical protein
MGMWGIRKQLRLVLIVFSRAIVLSVALVACTPTALKRSDTSQSAFHRDVTSSVAINRLSAHSNAQFALHQDSLNCSIPGLIDHTIVRGIGKGARGSEQFRQACVEHDYCYRYGAQTYGLKRSDCDIALFRESLKLCQLLQKQKSLKWCIYRARLVYRSVSAFGGFAFRSAKNPLNAKASAYFDYADRPLQRECKARVSRALALQDGKVLLTNGQKFVICTDRCNPVQGLPWANKLALPHLDESRKVRWLLNGFNAWGGFGDEAQKCKSANGVISRLLIGSLENKDGVSITELNRKECFPNELLTVPHRLIQSTEDTWLALWHPNSSLVSGARFYSISTPAFVDSKETSKELYKQLQYPPSALRIKKEESAVLYTFRDKKEPLNIETRLVSPVSPKAAKGQIKNISAHYAPILPVGENTIAAAWPDCKQHSIRFPIWTHELEKKKWQSWTKDHGAPRRIGYKLMLPESASCDAHQIAVREVGRDQMHVFALVNLRGKAAVLQFEILKSDQTEEKYAVKQGISTFDFYRWRSRAFLAVEAEGENAAFISINVAAINDRTDHTQFSKIYSQREKIVVSQSN